MAGIFDLFGGLNEPVKQASLTPGSMTNDLKGKSVMKSAVLGGTPAKLFGACNGKSKGLSVRSSSDLNIHVATPRSFTTKKDSSEQEFLKPKLTQVDVFGRPISPRSKSLQVIDSKLNSTKKLSPKLKSPKNINEKKLLEENIFKKPMPVNEAKKKEFVFPEPEKLCYYYDEEFEFNNIYARALEDDYKNLVERMSNNLEIQQDEGFESDSEMVTPSPVPAFNFPEFSDEESIMDYSLDFPEISDIDDDF